MNKTLSIGLAGFSFMIEENAYIKLKDYLSALRSSLEPSEADEVMHDIEIRMVEIFKESLGKREVINDADVEMMIAQIGTPEVIEEQEEAYYSEKSKKNRQTFYSGSRQLFRDPASQKIAGVCAGLAYYTGMDITIMRLIWVGVAVLGLFTAAISTSLIILVYIILWVVLPKAESASDFLKMKGKPLNFDSLKEESNKILKFANESTQRVGEIYTENKPYIQKTGSGIGNVLRYIFGGIFGFISLLLLLGIFAIFGIFGISKFTGINTFDFYYDNELSLVFRAMITLGTIVPAVLFGLLSIKLFSPKTKIRNLGYVLGILFIILLGFVTYFGVKMAKMDMKYQGTNENSENISINTTNDSILVDMKKVAVPQNFEAYDNVFSDKKTIFKKDDLDINVVRKADVKVPYLIVKKEAKGYNIPLEMKVPVEVVENKILLPNMIQYPYADRNRHYRVNYELVVPQSTKVISMNEDKINLDDYDANDLDLLDEDLDEDSIIVDGKKISEKTADKMINKNSKRDIKDLKIRFKDGAPEISIKTK